MQPIDHPQRRLHVALAMTVFAVLAAWPDRAATTEIPRPAAQFLAPLHTDDLPAIRQRKRLRALVTYSRTDFTIQPDGQPLGLQVELLDQYEKFLNRKVRRAVDRTHVVYVPTTFDRLLPDLRAGRGDLAAALLTVTPQRRTQVAFATGAVLQVDELVVVHKDVSGIATPDDLAGREVTVLRGSSYAEHLRALNRVLQDKGRPPVRVHEADSHLLSEDLLEMVNAGIVPVTVVDDYKARLWAQVLPDIRVLDEVRVSTDNTLGWAVRRHNPKLHASLDAFVKKVKKGTLLGNMLFKRYLENPAWITNPLANSERSKFRRVVGVFARYADRYGFDVLATTAQAYRESRLDHSKRSPRGAVGIMQLLPSTAADPNVGIPDIASLDDNIHAGVKYLAFLRDRYFADPAISAKDRLAFSWAAYNAGPAKVRRMRAKAAKMGLDRNVWFGNVEQAAARLVGAETVDYVRDVFKYYAAYALVREQLVGDIANTRATEPPRAASGGRRVEAQEIVDDVFEMRPEFGLVHAVDQAQP